MRILFMTEFPVVPYLGGIERVTYILAEKFLKKGHEVAFLAVNSKAYIEKENDFSSCQFFLEDCINEDERGINTIIKRFQPDIVINQLFTIEGANILDDIKDKNIKKVSVCHNQPFAVYGRERLAKKLTIRHNFKGKCLRYLGILMPWVYRKGIYRLYRKTNLRIIFSSDKVFLLSEKFILRLQKLLAIEEIEKFDAINNPNTFNSESIVEVKKENIILFVGRLENPQKNVKGFIDVWKKFHEHHKDWRAIIIGDGPHREIFESYAIKKSVESLEFVGSKKNISEYYKKSKILCLTSLYEGWGMVLTEAMASECVPVAFDSYESIHDIINSGENGFLIPAFDKEKMVEALNFLSQDEEKREKMAKKGKSSIKRFNAEIIADIWIDKLKSILDKKQ